MNSWSECKKILVIRADNMGDLIMSVPAIRAVKDTFRCSVSLLTSDAAAPAVEMIPFIDETITADLPWLKKEKVVSPEKLTGLADKIKNRGFDGCIIFTVYSQSSLPAAMLAWMSGIRLRLAYCRENPYDLLTNWIPDKEPYIWIRHQVKRDIALVESIGVRCQHEDISLSLKKEHRERMRRKLFFKGIKLKGPFFLFHPGVSEPKRTFPVEKWVDLVRETSAYFDLPILITGSRQDINLATSIADESGKKAESVAGLLTVPESGALIRQCSLLVSVNTGPVHIAAGFRTPVIVLYARTNPQHTPWKTPNRVLEYSVPREMESKNEVIRYVNDLVYEQQYPVPATDEILEAMKSLLASVSLAETAVTYERNQR